MTMPDVQGRVRPVMFAVPKPIVAFGLAACAWVLVCGLCVGCLDTLQLLGL